MQIMSQLKRSVISDILPMSINDKALSKPNTIMTNCDREYKESLAVGCWVTGDKKKFIFKFCSLVTCYEQNILLRGKLRKPRSL